MINDLTYRFNSYKYHQIEHKYGSNVHILSNPYLMTLLSSLAQPTTVQPTLNRLIEQLYSFLIFEAINSNFFNIEVSRDTRMKDSTSKGVYQGHILDPNIQAVVVDLARAGIYPSHICFEALHNFIEAKNIRQDHFFMNRKINKLGEVIGVDVSGSKIGGDILQKFVFLPDPMGATGGSLSHCISHYKNEIDGTPLKFIALHLIITPEYIRRMTRDHPDVEIIAVRLDRGLSNQEVLNSIPGTFPDKESGLNEIQYIVPGAGGVGEILNNSYV